MDDLWSSYDETPDVADHPHERQDQHTSYLDTIIGREPNEDSHPNCPDADVHDNGTCYVVDLEVPGVRDPATIQVRCTTLQALVVTGSIPQRLRSDGAGRSSNGIGKPEKSMHKTSDLDTGRSNYSTVRPKEGLDITPRLLLGERRTGSFRRSFYFPEKLNVGHINCELGAGVLHIELPKEHSAQFQGLGKVDVRILS